MADSSKSCRQVERDRKAFLVKVSLDDAPEGLRSGMSTEVNELKPEVRVRVSVRLS